MNLILKAANFARQAHQGQSRKFLHLPYIVHPARVAGRVAVHPQATETMVVAALLHDVVEDTAHELSEIGDLFGQEVAYLVAELTNPSKGSDAPRKQRKEQDRRHLREIGDQAKIIKLLDRIDNVKDLQGAPAGFVRLYCEESRLLLETIGPVDQELAAELKQLIDAADPKVQES